MKRYCHTCRGEYAESDRFCPQDGSPLVPESPGPPETGLAGTQLGPLLLERELQRTPQGVLYRARHREYERLVLARVFRPKKSLGPQVVAEMKNEVARATALTHPNLLKVHELVETEEGYLALVMEHVEAEGLDHVLAELGALEQELALAITRQVLAALEYAHSRMIVHRNLSPSSILLVRSGGAPGSFVKLTELGLSKRAKEDPDVPPTTEIVNRHVERGTPWYLAPEALSQHTTDHRADLYAAGMILYQMLTGVIPFADSDGSRLVERITSPKLHPAPLWRVRPDYPFDARLDGIVARSIAKAPGKRWQTAAAFHRALARIRPRSFSLSKAAGLAVATALAVWLLFGAAIEPGEDGRARPRLWQDPGQGRVTRLVEWGVGRLVTLVPLARKPPVPVAYPLPRPAAQDLTGWERHARKHGRERAEAEIVAEMVRIPGGSFRAGSDDAQAEEDERPERSVTLAEYWIDRHEVTQGEYRRFVEDTDRAVSGRRLPVPARWRERRPPEGEEDYPVAGVTWHEARLYARWAGKRLPTEHEWERAARGEGPRRWPWGDEFDRSRACYRDNPGGGAGTVPARKTRELGASPAGLLHLAGNVFEWVEDPYRAGDPSHRAIRGGSFRSDPPALRTSYRDAFRAELSAPDIGFRCVYSPSRRD